MPGASRWRKFIANINVATAVSAEQERYTKMIYVIRSILRQAGIPASRWTPSQGKYARSAGYSLGNYSRHPRPLTVCIGYGILTQDSKRLSETGYIALREAFMGTLGDSAISYLQKARTNEVGWSVPALVIAPPNEQLDQLYRKFVG